MRITLRCGDETPTVSALLWSGERAITDECRPPFLSPGREGSRETRTHVPDDLDGYVRDHWTEWENQWQPIDSLDTSDAILRIDPGEPMYLVARGMTHYLVASATRVSYRTAA